jgi:hypothetical protein
MHPHSHIITSFLPSDAVATRDAKGRNAFVSNWFTEANQSAGLGRQHRITEIQSAAATSRYVAKYMFKSAMQEEWPPAWKRVRYSQNWPILPKNTPEFICVLRSKDDWKHADKQGVLFICASHMDYEIAAHHIGLVLPPTGLTENG